MRSSALFAAVLSSAAAIAFATPAFADEPTGKQVRYRFKDATTNFGNLHLQLNIIGYQLSDPDGGLNTTVSGMFELGENMLVRAHAAFPFLIGVGPSSGPVRLEGGVGFHGTSLDVEEETVETGRTDTQVQYIKVPVLNRNSRGLGVGVMYRDNLVSTAIGDDENAETRGKHLTLYGGFSFINSAGYDLEIEGKSSSFFNYRFLTGGLDVLFDVVQSYGAEPNEDPIRFGGRLWAESIFGTTFGLSGRLEIGYYPGDAGFYILASIGGGLNLDI